MRVLLVCGLILVGLAGCSSTPDAGAPSSTSTSASPDPTADSYMVMVMGFPTTPVARNSTFTFTDHVSGDVTRTSDHIGAHFGPVTAPVPSTTIYTTACNHTHGDLPGLYEVTCTAPANPGTYHLRGHARITTASGPVDWWSDELTFTVP
ncbi:MAG TPA: hypothetical protein VM327_00195 [Candidatus Thermoplasmatota archaeon]|nr:hypothetical protein [Candidatus Thermoplasmatota archaeon]